MALSTVDTNRRLRLWGVLGLTLIISALGIYGLVRRTRHTRQPPPIAVAPVPTLPPGPPDPGGIVIHSSNTPAKVRDIVINAARLEKIHAKDHPHWAVTYEGQTYHIGYHYVVLPDGTIEKGRPDHCEGAHARKFNHWLGICVIGAFDTSSNPHWHPSTPTPEQVAAVTSLCKELMSKYHITPDRVKRHRDVNQTWCPGRRFPYTDILADLQLYASTHPEVYQTPARVANAPSPSDKAVPH